ncbi:MAG: HAMP domain-containing histidine kinase [Bacteroidetes bacterium]|nr:HAMP domain-containing histidine kinase [Bacteroidota bacterium]
MKHFHIEDVKGNLIAENLTNDCRNCYSSCSTIGKLMPCPLYGGERRHGVISTTKSRTFLCCDTTKTTKLFREKLEALSYAYPDLVIPKKDIEEKTKKSEQQKVNRLVHNLSSINAHNIQEIYDLVPQSVLSSNWKKQVDYIEKEVKSHPKKAAMMFLRLAKHSIHMKSEFSIYRKLEREETVGLDFKSYPIRNVLLNVLHTFFVDFSNNGIYVEVEDYYGKVLIDYETIQVAIYHLIENASKYARRDSTVYIKFQESESDIKVIFNMVSAHIEPSEKDQIFWEGFSGSSAKKMMKNGDGIGMWRIKQMMELNKGSCSVVCGSKSETLNGFDFSENSFTLRFRKYSKSNVNQS